MKKKLSKISVLLVLMLTLALCFAFGASAEETTYTEGYYTYTVTDDKATITAVDTAISGDITTPATLGGYPVTVIGKEAFYHCSGITSLVVSEGVEVIDDDAFTDIGKVDSITLPDSLTTLGEQPFLFIEVDSITIPKNVSSIDPLAFICSYVKRFDVAEDNAYFSVDEDGVLYNKDKTKLVCVPHQYEGETFVVPETVKEIAEYAVFGCPNIKTLILPEGFEIINECSIVAFEVKELTIPSTVKTIDSGFAAGYWYLEKITVDENNPYFSSEDGVLFNKDKTELIYYPAGKPDREYTVPETVTNISSQESLYLREITFLNDVEGYFNSDLLTDIIFKEGVTKINYYYASDSDGLKKNIYIEGMNTEMPKIDYFQTSRIFDFDPDAYAEGTKQMYKTIYGIPMTQAEAEVVVEAWREKYEYDKYLDEPVINAEIICHSDSTAAAYAQENGIPYRTKCFYGEPDAEGTMKCINCDGTRSYYHDENEAFENGFIYVVYKGEAIILEAGYSNDDFTGYVEIPETLGGYPVTTLPEFLFQNDSDITGIFIPASVTSIGRGAFENCSDLISITVDKNNPAYTSVEGVLYDKNMKVLHHYPKGSTRTSYTVPDGVIGLGYAVFYGCDTLESITLPDTLILIGDHAFCRCTSLVDLKLPEGVKLIGEDAFENCTALTDLVIPEGAVVYGTENTVVDEYGVTFSEDMKTLIKYPAESTNTSYTIPDGVTTIGKDAFYNASNLTEIIIPDSVTTIGEYAFHDASNLTEIIIPDSVTTIGGYAFYGASNLTEIIVSDNIISIGSSTLNYTGYYNDTANWEDGYLYLGKYLIAENSDSTDFVLKEGTLGIAYSAANSDYTSVTLCEGLKSIGNHNFNYNDLITSVEIPDSVVYIGKGSFSYCDALSEIKFNTDNLEHLGEGAFSYTAYTYDSNNWKDGVCTIGNAIIACDIGTVKVDENIKFIVDENAYWMPMGFDVDENNPYFSSDETGSLYNKDKTKLIRYNGFCKNESYVIPETVKEIGEYAFSYSMYLKELTVPDSVEIIGEGAFEAVITLENIYFQPDNLYLGGSYLGTCGELALVEDEVALWEEYWNIVGLSLKFERGEFIPTEEEIAEFESRIAYIEENMISNRWDFAQGTIHCHEGSLTDIYALSYGVNVEYTHIFKNWTYDWDGLERTAKCLYCDATTTESLRSEEDNKIEFIAPADEETTFVVETVEDEASDNYILVTEALEAVEGPAEIEKIYDITLKTSEGVAVQPDGSVQVKLPVEESHGNYKVFRVNDDGRYTDMNATVVDGYVVFVTDHFSLYVVVDTTEKTCEHEFDYTKSEDNLTRPRQVDGTWVDGYYTYTCSLCGETKTEVAKRADYAEYNVVETRFIGIFLNEDIDVNIRQKLLDELKATEVGFEENFIESEQQTLDRFTAYLLACIERAEVCVEGTHYFTKYEEVTAPKCGVAGLEKSVCDYCGAEDENEIPALKHVPLAAVKEKEVAPTCEAAGSYDSVVYCDLCGEEISRETITVSAKGHTKVTVPGKAATCKATGLTDGVKCSVCGKILTAQKTIAKADHKDKNGDYKCDYGCGHEFERPTPDKCDHMCHQSGFMGFIWKIVQFFWKLFKMNPVCECGAAHY